MSNQTMPELSKKKSWKSLDAAAMEGHFDIPRSESISAAQDGMSQTKDKSVDDLLPKQNLQVEMLPPPCKHFRRVPSACPEGTSECPDLEFSETDAQSPAISDFDFVDVDPKSQQKMLRNYRKGLNFNAGLQIEAERRRQSKWSSSE
jgi:hypothetical protein